MHIAIQQNNVEIVKLLLEMPGIDVNIPLVLYIIIYIVQIISLLSYFNDNYYQIKFWEKLF